MRSVQEETLAGVSGAIPKQSRQRGAGGGPPRDCEVGGAEGSSAVINWLQFSLPPSQGSRPPRCLRPECLLYREPVVGAWQRTW